MARFSAFRFACPPHRRGSRARLAMRRNDADRETDDTEYGSGDIDAKHYGVYSFNRCKATVSGAGPILHAPPQPETLAASLYWRF